MTAVTQCNCSRHPDDDSRYDVRMSGKRPTIQQVMLDTAVAHSARSTCGLGRQHGAVIHRGGRVLSTGYNGPPAGWPHCGDNCRLVGKDALGHDWRRCPAVHAEVNALVNAARSGVNIKGAAIMVTRSPCMECLLVLCNSGMESVTWPEDGEWLEMPLDDPHQAHAVWSEYAEGG